MDPDIAVGGRFETKRDSLIYKPSGIFAKELEDELMKFTVNSEECKLNSQVVEQSEDVCEEVHGNAGVGINITECTKYGGRELIEAEYHDATESSSSFGNSDSEVENVDPSEIRSDFRGNVLPTMNLDGFIEPFRMRKKKMTNHWRYFIKPLMWRCKWTELQILKFQSQAKKYDRELEEYNQQKKVQLQNFMLESLGVKSCHFTANNDRSGIRRRKKRKRNEEKMDIAAYMSQHNLFSHYENRNYLAKDAVKDDELKNQASLKVNIDDELWINDEQSFLGPGDKDNSLEILLGQIEFLHDQVVKMKSRVEKVICEEPGKFSLIDESSLRMPVEALTGSLKNGMPLGTYITSPLKFEHNMSDVFLPESAVTSHGVVVPHVNNESTTQVCFDDTYIKVENEIHIDNPRLKEEMNSLEEVKIQPIPSPLASKDDFGSSSTKVLAEADRPMEDQPSPKMRSMSKLTAPKTKRKGRKRKGIGQRRRRSTS